MKFYPYSQIQTKNLKALLISSRILGILGYILFFSAIIIGVYGVIIDQPQTFDMGGAQATLSAPGSTAPAIIAALGGLISSVCVLAFSGLCAAVVSCEYKYTTSIK